MTIEVSLPDPAAYNAAGLGEYVRDGGSDTELVESCWAEAVRLVVDYLGATLDASTDPATITGTTVPIEILGRAFLEVGAELYNRRAAKNGIHQFATPDAPPVRIARDPMRAAYPILDPYIGGGFA